MECCVGDIGSPEAEGEVVNEDVDLEALFDICELGAEDAEANDHEDIETHGHIE
jgi:hypothetical protein